MKYYSLNNYLKNTFGCKVYKIAIDGGFTCPNRDGTIDTRGCIFCSKGGSGDFAQSRSLTITQQIENGKKLVENKNKNGKYIAYFQAFTNTYANVDELKEKYTQAIGHPDVVAISIATRPDCLADDVLQLLSQLNKVKPVFVELGLQTINSESAKYIRRGYDLSVYDKAVDDLKRLNINVVTHLILGLPGETKEDILKSVEYVCKVTDGIKLQLLHIIEGTDLAEEYKQGKISVLTMEEYVDIVKDCVAIIPNNVVVHRLTGDGAKKDLLAPLWSGDKKKVLNNINFALNN